MMLQSFADLDSALAAEEALWDSMSEGCEPACLFWSTGRGLVAPRSLSRNAAFAESARQSAARGWPVSLRSSGGDVVPQGPGTLNFCRVWMPSGPISIEEGYRAICDPIRSIVGGYCASVDACFCDGKYNVVVAGRKVAGTAQRRRQLNGRLAILAHAMILVDEDIEAGVDAVNRFQNSLGRSDTVDTIAHVNASEVTGDHALTPARLASAIARAMQGAPTPYFSHRQPHASRSHDAPYAYADRPELHL